MAESAYNERFIFPDPYDRQAINRTTRYRLKKKREGTLYIDDSIESVAPTPKKSVDTAVVNCDDPCGPFVEEVDVQDDCEQLEQGYSSYDIRNEADSDEDRVNLSDEGSDAEYNMHEDVDENEACTQEHQVQHHIFPGSSLTVAASHTLVMKYKTKHNITLEGLKDLLRLIKLHCPVPNECTTSLHRFRQQFPTDSLVHHFFCNFCLQALESDSNDRCSNVACRKYLTKADCSSFIEVPLAPQLKKILERKLS